MVERPVECFISGGRGSYSLSSGNFRDRSNMASSLVSRNITVSGHRTSMRLEPAMWDALSEVARREGVTINDICTMVDARRRESSLTAALRVHIVVYFRAAATEHGHLRAGHGPGGLAEERSLWASGHDLAA